MAEYDNVAFDAMKDLTRSAPDKMFKDDRVFTESLYNTQATSEEKRRYDRKSFDVLREIFKADKKRFSKNRKKTMYIGIRLKRRMITIH